MKVRYTATATREFAQAVDYLLDRAPRVAGDFADSIDRAVQLLLENPYSAQKTESQGVRRKYIREFRYSLFYVVEPSVDELVILNIRHAARRWPWEHHE